MFRALGRMVGYLSDTPLRMGVAVVVSAVLLGAIEFMVHELLRNLNVSPLTDAALDALLLGLSSGLAVWILLTGQHERRARVRQDLLRIAELNHEIRNALQVISYSQFDATAKQRDLVIESVSRIDDVLRRVVPVVGGAFEDDLGTATGR